jgi:hypothetical protein
VLLTHWPLHKWNPVLQITLHAGGVPAQVACAFVVFRGQGVHEAPQVDTLVFETHLLPHWWYPVSQTRPHTGVAPVQVGVLWAGDGHAVHEAPHPLTLLFAMQMVPHR